MAVAVVVLTLASLLISHTTKLNPYETILLTVLLWLAASFRDSNLSIEANFVFFFVIARVAVASAIPLRLLKFLFCVAPAVWVTLVTQLMFGAMYPFYVFLGSYALLLILQSAFSSKVIGRQTVYTDSSGLVESRWYDWSNTELLTWIQSQHISEQELLATILAEQKLRGVHIPALSVERLHSMGLPYGAALDLYDNFQRLQAQYPNARAVVGSQQSMYLEQHDLEYNRPSIATERSVYTNDYRNDNYILTPTNETSPIVIDSFTDILEPGAGEQAQELLRAQFGLGLPRIRVKPSFDTRWPSDSSNQQEQISTDQVPPTFTELPPDFLANMPAHIAQIAKNDPELVQRIWNMRRQKVGEMTDITDQNQIPLTPIREVETSTFSTTKTETQEPLEDEWDAEEGERIELIRKRPPYKTTGLRTPLLMVAHPRISND
jgi:hypothetical protein